MRFAKLFSFVAFALCLACPTEARSLNEQNLFMKRQPCPSSQSPTRYGETCRGWKIDYIVPLKCGGRDKADNMQWVSSRMTTDAKKAHKNASSCKNK